MRRSVLYTAGYTDRTSHLTFNVPPLHSRWQSIFSSAPPYPEVQQRAYASALVLTLIVLIVSLGSRLVSARLGRFINR